MGKWEQLHPELQAETPLAIETTQATTPQWKEESQQGPEGSPIEAMNILEDMHRCMEAMITAAANFTPQMHTKMPLSYEDAPQERHSPTLIYNYVAYVGAT
jgi:hypothetical protein